MIKICIPGERGQKSELSRPGSESYESGVGESDRRLTRSSGQRLRAHHLKNNRHSDSVTKKILKNNEH